MHCFEIYKYKFETYRDLETRVMGHTKLLEMTIFVERIGLPVNVQQ